MRNFATRPAASRAALTSTGDFPTRSGTAIAGSDAVLELLLASLAGALGGTTRE